MKIIIISKYASGYETEKPTRQYFYAKHLSKMGHDVKLIYSRSNGKQNIPKFNSYYKSSKKEKLEIVILNGPIINLGFNIKRLWSWIHFEINNFRYFPQIKKWKPDVVMVSSLSILTFLFGIFLKRKLKIPLILEVRDLYPLTLIEIGGFSQKNPLIKLLKKIEKKGYQNADLIISSLENTEKYFHTVSEKKINYLWLPTGFEEEIYESNPNEQVEDICNIIINLKNSGKFVVGYAGTLGKANALEELMKITTDKKIMEENIHFIFIGDGPLKQFYQQLYQSNSCTFFPALEKKYIPLILKNCDILINTWLDKPIYRFGISPNKWIEYMYAARPILLAFNYESKIFKEASCGWQIPAQNAEELKKAIINAKNTEAEMLDCMGTNGKNYLINNLSYETLSKTLDDKIKDIIERFS